MKPTRKSTRTTKSKPANDKKLRTAVAIVLAELDRQKKARENDKADQPDPLIVGANDALFDADLELSVIKELFQSIVEFAIDVDARECQHESTAIQAIAEKGARECEELAEKLDKARTPLRLAKYQKAEAAQEETSHA